MSAETETMVQQVDAEKFSDFRDTVISSLNDRIRDTQSFQNTSNSVKNFENMRDLFKQIKDTQQGG